MKRYVYIVIVICAFLATPITSEAQRVMFWMTSLRTDQLDNSTNRQMIQYFYTLIVDHAQGHTVVPYIAIELENGNFHKFASGEDIIAAGNELSCPYQTTHFYDQWQAVYLDALNPLPGTNTYYVRIYVYDTTIKQWIGKSDALAFKATGSDSSSSSGKQSSNSIQFSGIMFKGSSISLPAIVRAEPPMISKRYVRSKASKGEDEVSVKTQMSFTKSYAGITYSFNVTGPGEVTIGSVYTGGLYPKSIELPSKIINNGVTYIVTGLGKQCMQGSSAENIILPKQLKRIGNGAFLDCKFEHFVIPSTVTQIDAHAFRMCSQLREITIPASVRQIGYSPFRGCIRLQNINVESGNPNYTSIDGILYNKNVTELIQIPYPRKMDTYIAPATLVSVNREAIYTQNIQNFIFPCGLQYIARDAFKGSNVRTIVLPATIKAIDAGAFGGVNRPNIGDGLEGRYIGVIIVNSSKPLNIHQYTFRDDGSKVYNRGFVGLSSNYYKNNPILYVPKGSRDYYLQADGWNEIKDVREVDFEYR